MSHILGSSGRDESRRYWDVECWAGGKDLPGATYRVTAEAIHRYAAATNDSGPAVTSPDPVAPPAFPCVLGIKQLNQVMYDPDLNVDMSMLVHARQEHILHLPIKAGDVMQVTTVLEAVDLADTGHTFTVAIALTNQDARVAAEARARCSFAAPLP